MAQGLALLVGLNEVDLTKYNGWDGKNGCWGCELDVDNVARILVSQGFQTTTLKTREATHEGIIENLQSIVGSLSEEDILVFYFSGHGGQQPDQNGDELDGHDETLIAFDERIIDDELNDIWLTAKPGTRIVMISDSCNSGTNHKGIRTIANPTPIVPLDNISNDKMQAQLIHYGGCRDGFTSSGYRSGGAFTTALCNTWANGAFPGDYAQLFQNLKTQVSTGQIPTYIEYGPVSDSFRKSRPFQIQTEVPRYKTTGLSENI